MTVVTKIIADVAGNPDFGIWRFGADLALASDNVTLKSSRVVSVIPEAVDGKAVLTVDLDPGPVAVEYKGITTVIEVPDSDETQDLLALLDAGSFMAGGEGFTPSAAYRGSPVDDVTDDGQGGAEFWVLGESVGSVPMPGAVWSNLVGRPDTVVNAASFAGLVADGATDVSSVLASALDTLADGQVLQLDQGAYYVPNLRNYQVTGRFTLAGVKGVTRLLGDGVLSADASTDIMLKLTPDSALTLKDIIVEDNGVLVGLEDLTEVGDITITGCEFINSGGAVGMESVSVSFLAGQAAGRLYSFDNFKMTDCVVSGCETGVGLGAQGGWKSVEVSGCTFTDVGFIGVHVGSEGAVSGDEMRDPAVYQPLQSGVNIHGNTFRHMRATTYTKPSGAVNAIAVWGTGVNIHGNFIDDVGCESWGDCEGIYIKAVDFDIHNNVLLNAGGNEAAIISKGGEWIAETTIASGSGGDTLPQSTINVASTSGFPETLSDSVVRSAMVLTSNGWERISWTGKTDTTLTGCTGGTGIMSTGAAVKGSAHNNGYLQGLGWPGTVRDNTISFTLEDKAQKGIQISTPMIVASGNLISGATAYALAVESDAQDVLFAGNTVRNHKGASAIYAGSRRCTVADNRVIDHNNSYGGGSANTYLVTALNGFDLNGIRFDRNYLYQPLAEDGTLSPVSSTNSMFRVDGVGSGLCSVDEIYFNGNVGRNILNTFSLSGSTDISNVTDIDTDVFNEAGNPPVKSIPAEMLKAQRDLPT